MIINFESSKKINAKDRLAIASIIQEAFWDKMAWYFHKVSKEEAFILIEKAITYNMGFYYKENDKVLGVALLSRTGVPYLNIGPEIRKKIGFWRGWLLSISYGMMSKRKDQLYLQMLGVSPMSRGKGVGTKMLTYLFALAREEGMKKVILDVIDTNPKAKNLYEREGFVLTKYINTKLFTRNMGFNGVYIMQKTID